MQLSDLRIFLAVASTGSFSAGARLLDVSPMQVSRRLVALEQELGARLFHRTTRSVSLTEEGAALLPHARTMTDAEDCALAELGQSLANTTGTLRLTAPSVIGLTIVIPLLTSLMKTHPELRCDLDLSDKVVDIVGQGFDLALRVAPLADSELVARKIAINPRVICASPHYLAENGIPRLRVDLQKHHCIGLQAMPRWPFIVDGKLIHVRTLGRLNTSSVEAVRTAALNGFGLAMLTYWDVYEQIKSGTLVQVKLADAAMEELGVWAVMPTRHYVPPRVTVFLDALETVLSKK